MACKSQSLFKTINRNRKEGFSKSKRDISIFIKQSLFHILPVFTLIYVVYEQPRKLT